jgi:hypothetical protein
MADNILSSRQADDIDMLVSVRAGLQSLADYAAAALELARRLEQAPAVARAYARRLSEASPSDLAEVCERVWMYVCMCVCVCVCVCVLEFFCLLF